MRSIETTDRMLLNKFMAEPMSYDLEYYIATILELLEYSSKTITQITNHDILNWVNYLKTIKVNDALIKESQAIVNQFFSTLYAKGLLTTDPTIHNSESNLQYIS